METRRMMLRKLNPFDMFIGSTRLESSRKPQSMKPVTLTHAAPSVNLLKSSAYVQL